MAFQTMIDTWIKDAKQTIAKQTIADLLAAGFFVTMNDGEEDTVERSQDADAIFAAMFSTDEDWLKAFDAEGKQRGGVRFIYGNTGWYVISDHPTNLETVLAKTMALCEVLEQECEA